jgi:hypothetical protein
MPLCVMGGKPQIMPGRARPSSVRPEVVLVRVDRELFFAAIANQRRQIATLVDGLDDTQLATPSLCAGYLLAWHRH